jgi:hypothetical protein
MVRTGAPFLLTFAVTHSRSQTAAPLDLAPVHPHNVSTPMLTGGDVSGEVFGSRRCGFLNPHTEERRHVEP